MLWEDEMWEVELRACVGPLRIPLWRTTEQETVDRVLVRLKQRLAKAGTARSDSVRQMATSWLYLLDAFEGRLHELRDDTESAEHWPVHSREMPRD